MIGIFEITDIIGTVSFALSGFLIGVREKLDLFGVLIVSILTALGGGIIRDAIVNRLPYSLTHVLPITIVLIVILLCIMFRIADKRDIDQTNYFIVTDAVGLVSFSITGALIGVESGLNIYGVIILALLTAIGGGLVRDMLINRVPLIMRKELYGSVAIFIGFTIYILNHFKAIGPLNLLILFIIGLTFRLYVYFKKINLPSF